MENIIQHYISVSGVFPSMQWEKPVKWHVEDSKCDTQYALLQSHLNQTESNQAVSPARDTVKTQSQLSDSLLLE